MALTLLMLAPAGGCGRVSPFRSIERSIQAELPQRIGPADRYDVRVSHSMPGLLAGRIPWVEIHGRQVRAAGGLILDDLVVRLEGVRFSRSDHTVRQIEQTRFDARIGAGSVAAMLHTRRPDLRDVRVRIGRGQVRVHVTPTVLGIGVPLDIEGRPEVAGPTTIDFAVSQAAILRLGLPGFVVRRLETRLNPIVDLRALPLSLSLTSVQVEGAAVAVCGTTVFQPVQIPAPGEKRGNRGQGSETVSGQPGRGNPSDP